MRGRCLPSTPRAGILRPWAVGRSAPSLPIAADSRLGRRLTGRRLSAPSPETLTSRRLRLNRQDVPVYATPASYEQLGMSAWQQAPHVVYGAPTPGYAPPGPQYQQPQQPPSSAGAPLRWLPVLRKSPHTTAAPNIRDPRLAALLPPSLDTRMDHVECSLAQRLTRIWRTLLVCCPRLGLLVTS